MLSDLIVLLCCVDVPNGTLSKPMLKKCDALGLTNKKNPPEIRVTSGQNFYRDCLHYIANFCATVLNIFSKEIISNNTKYRKQILKII